MVERHLGIARCPTGASPRGPRERKGCESARAEKNEGKKKKGKKMNTGNRDAAVRLGPSTESSRPARTLRQWWSAIATLLVLAVFAQAAFAGLMLSGVDWGRTAHSVNAVALIASTLTAGLAALVTLRRISHGTRLGLTLLSLALLVVLQTAIGMSTAKGANLMWVHLPLGVALVGLAAHAASVARRLGGD
jgi:hypothetical protein